MQNMIILILLALSIIIFIQINQNIKYENEKFISHTPNYLLEHDPYVNIRSKKYYLTRCNDGYFLTRNNKYYVPYWYAINNYYKKVLPYLEYKSYLY